MALQLLLGLLILSMAGDSSASFCVCKPGVSPDMMQKAIDYACGAGADCGPINPNGKCYNPNSITAHCSYAVNSYFQKNAAKGATCDFQGVATQTNSDPSGGGGCSFSASSGGSTGSSTGSPTSPVTNVPTSSPTTPTTTPVTPVSGSGGTPTSGSGGNPGVTPVSGSGGTPTSGSGGTPVSGGTGTGSTGTGSTGTGGMGSGTGTGGMGTNPTTASPYTASPNAGNGVFGGVGTGLAPTGSYDDSHAVTLQSVTLGSTVMILAISTIMLVWN